jgi:hypothetical protein
VQRIVRDVYCRVSAVLSVVHLSLVKFGPDGFLDHSHF